MKYNSIIFDDSDITLIDCLFAVPQPLQLTYHIIHNVSFIPLPACDAVQDHDLIHATDVRMNNCIMHIITSILPETKIFYLFCLKCSVCI